MKLITFIILSYNRPCQLESTIRSMKKFLVDWQKHKVVVLYRSTNEKFKQGYDIVKNIHPDITYIEEINFRVNMDFILDNYKSDYLTTVCDDDIWKSPFDVESNDFKVFDLNEPKGICCFSLRLHPRIIKCHPMGNTDTPPPQIFKHENPYIWNWVGLKGDWGYPMSVDGHIFKYDYLSSLLMRRDILSVSHIEVIISQLSPSQTKPYMACSNKSALFNIPLNAIQEICKNINMGVTVDYLNERFLKGDRIDIDKYIDFDNVSPHQEVEIKWKQIN